jgi:hypothetical protein
MNEEGDLTARTTRFRMETGLEVLDHWAETATETDKEAVYTAMFAMIDGTLFKSYRIVDDFQHLSELYVLVNDDLAVKIRINSFDSFGIVHIVPRDEPSLRYADDRRPRRGHR